MIRARSNQPFPRYEVLHEAGDDMCTVVFYTHVRTELMPDGDVMYTAELLCITVQHTDDVLRDVRDNYTEWLKMAIEDLLKGETEEALGDML